MLPGGVNIPFIQIRLLQDQFDVWTLSLQFIKLRGTAVILAVPVGLAPLAGINSAIIQLFQGGVHIVPAISYLGNKVNVIPSLPPEVRVYAEPGLSIRRVHAIYCAEGVY